MDSLTGGLSDHGYGFLLVGWWLAMAFKIALDDRFSFLRRRDQAAGFFDFWMSPTYRTMDSGRWGFRRWVKRTHLLFKRPETAF